MAILFLFRAAVNSLLTMSDVVPGMEYDASRADESNLPRILGIITAFHVLALTTVMLRVYVRIKLIRSLGRDDWTMAASAFCAFGGWIIFVYQATQGLGRHSWALSQRQSSNIDAGTFWMSIISSSAGICLLKVSIALNLMRMSPNKWYSWTLWASIAFVSAYSIMGVFTFLLHCHPMRAHWDTSVQGKCYPPSLFIFFAVLNSSFNIFTDVLFATYPIPIIWTLQMKRKTRLYLIGVLSLGYCDSWITFWAGLQINIGITTACTPSLKPLVSNVLKLSSYQRSTDAYGSRSRGATNNGTGQSRSRSVYRDQYTLEEIDSKDSDEIHLGRSTPHHTAMVMGPSSIDDSNSDDRALSDGSASRHPPSKGIVRTTEVIVS
ncbi:hypothetical protein GMORB2_7768 [Geosmithia morbida]|uniref:Rhodopsin domain-containing protein n=1 Tax=Geosmithia morbida TaxID=1094350 RepID=A0A9P4YSW5_9HYPO|nr:uncharacterized protein GMORB2_7768 [Geosmithia morbida]KAF4122175.1 hypothetical protein GMORB2_7768 [Geosmithia morbida]